MSEQGQLNGQESSEVEKAQSGGRYLVSVESEQERFNRFIRAENERLNRLIRNLYLHFQLEHYSERDLYDRICQEVAEYFRAASCELYIVRYEEKTNEGKLRRLTKWLELVGAFGPARRALRQQYVTQRSRSRYEIPIVGPVDPTKIPSWTRQAFVRPYPTRYASCLDFRPIREDVSSQGPVKKDEWGRDSPRQVIWYQDGLYNSCRCSLAAPLVREGEGGIDCGGIPYHRRVGLIKLENRTPYGVAEFSSVPSGHGDQNHLFFPELWKIVALRPYIRDLRESVKRGHDPFLPLHNNVGWQQYFEDHPLGAHYFRQMLRELSRYHMAQDTEAVVQKLPGRYRDLVRWLENLLECLIRLESWLQHLQYVCRLICGLDETPTLDRPAPSLFNVYNLRAAYTRHLLESSSRTASQVSNDRQSSLEEQNRYAYDVVRDALLDRLVKQDSNGEHSKNELRVLESVLSAIGRFKSTVDKLDRVSAEDSLHPKGIKDLLEPVCYAQGELKTRINNFKNYLNQVKSETLRTLDEDFQILDISSIQFLPGELDAILKRVCESVKPIQMFVEREAEDLIQNLCQQRADAMREKLRSPANENFKVEDVLIEQALRGKFPSWDFQGTLEDEVLSDLKSICKAFEDELLEEHQLAYELISEEAEACRIKNVVQSILNRQTEKERWYGVACALSDQHDDDLARTGCQSARALAAATMCADSFHQIDEKRLVFIASHVVQVLDSHLLHQARQRKLELDYPALNLLGLEQFGLELLDILCSCSQRVAYALHYLLEHEAYRAGEDTPQLQSELPSLKVKEWVDAMAKSVNQDDSEPEKFQYGFMAIRSPVVNKVWVSVLHKILWHSQLMHKQTVPVHDDQGRMHQIIFQPRETLESSGNGRLAEVILHLKGEGEGRTDKSDTIELLVCSNDSKALRERDLRVLWCAVRVMEDTLEAIEATIGGT